MGKISQHGNSERARRALKDRKREDCEIEGKGAHRATRVDDKDG
jgi:hypothetical protein